MSLDELRALEQAATPAPWEIAERGWPDAPYVIRGGEGFMENVRANALFVVAARNALPDLLGRVEAAEAERDAYRAALERLASMEGFEGAGVVSGDSFAERELRARGFYAHAVLAARAASGPAAAGRTTSKETR